MKAITTKPIILMAHRCTTTQGKITPGVTTSGTATANTENTKEDGSYTGMSDQPKVFSPQELEEIKEYYREVEEDEAEEADMYDVEVPLELTGPCASQSELLYKIAASAEELEKVEEDVEVLRDFIQAPEIETFLSGNDYTDEIKAQVILASLKEANLSESTKEFIESLVGSQKYSNLGRIFDGFEEIMCEHRKETRVTVLSAQPLNNVALDEIVGIIKSKVSEDAKIILQAKVDPQLIDGYILQVASETVDTSFTTFAQKLVHQWSENAKAEQAKITAEIKSMGLTV